MIISLKRSRLLLIVLITIHLLALLTELILLPGVIARVVLSLIVVASFGFYFLKFWSKSSLQTIIKLQLLHDGSWLLENSLADPFPASLHSCYISRFLVILNYCLKNRRTKLSLPIFTDAIDKVTMRRLRLHLLRDRCN